MHLIPNHAREQELLESLGLERVEQLFEDIPAHLQIDGLNLPDAEPERALVRRLRRMLGTNRTYDNMPIFLGGGFKPQMVPASVKAVAHRQELINAYTPYQPEVSQGLLQCLFEFQSLMADITRMEVVNSSMYDGMTALGEAALMAARVYPKRNTILVPKHLHADKRSVLDNYVVGVGLEVTTFGFDETTGTTDLDSLKAALNDDVAMVYVENPNFFGIFEESIHEVEGLVHDAGALLCLGIDPTALGIMTPPGDLGADIVVGEASAIGGAPALGGPLLGLFATTKKLVRKMPGRLIGATLDEDNKRGYVMTLQAREQHIRRTKATSNICSNEALLSIQAAIHLTLLGRKGLRDMGLQNLAAGQKLAVALESCGFQPRFTGAFYNEVVTTVSDPEAVHEACLEAGVHAGLRLSRHKMGLDDAMLWGSSPVHVEDDYEQLVAALPKEVLA